MYCLWVVVIDRLFGMWIVVRIFFFLVCRCLVDRLIGFFIVVSVSSCSRWFWMMLCVVLMLL